MTGYAVNTYQSAAGTITIELKSVNSRFLDLQFRINDDLRSLEPTLREAIMGRVNRGKVECRLSFGRKVTSGSIQTLNIAMLASLVELQTSVLQKSSDSSPLSVGDFLRWPGMIEEAVISEDMLQTEVQSTMATTLTAFIASRAREGAALIATIIAQIDAMEVIVQRITPLVPQVIAQFQQKAIARMQEVLGLVQLLVSNNNNVGQNTTLSREEAMDRIRQEVTLYGIRIDITEELSRLGAHLTETRRILKTGGQVGKRLDFMMQELNREANTVGSKATIKELADASMELKLLIDQMREQVQNLE
ncbi:MAG: YicC family protein [Glaciimonas sp.]|nr:YicC family protein [Glaciimonas sp.]